jgi:hypothetical protein
MCLMDIYDNQFAANPLTGGIWIFIFVINRENRRNASTIVYVYRKKQPIWLVFNQKSSSSR